jgi:uncharacterized membrane protein YidH (DUF202 family)
MSVLRDKALQTKSYVTFRRLDSPWEGAMLRTWMAASTASGRFLMDKIDQDKHLYDEVQLLLAEKRTALSGLRTGIAVFALPLSVLSVLVATSRYYDPTKVIGFLVVLMLLNVGLIILGTYLIFHSLMRIRHYDALIRQLKIKHSSLASYLD